MVEGGFIPPGDYFDDEKWEWEQISPTDSRRKWVCDYCPHFTTCVAYEAGIDIAPVPGFGEAAVDASVPTVLDELTHDQVEEATWD
jgi:hypothetical protein